MAIEKESALLQDSEEALMKRRAMAIEKINAYMQKLETMKKEFDPLPHFALHRLLSQISPQFYNREELTKIEKINQVFSQKTNHSLISESKVEREEVSGLKRCRPNNEESKVERGEVSGFKRCRPNNKESKMERGEVSGFKRCRPNNEESKVERGEVSGFKRCRPNNEESKVERGEVSGLKRCSPNNEGSMSDGERRVKPKLTIKRKTINKKKEIASSPPPELPSHVNNMIKVLDGTDIKYVMRKRFFSTDLNYGNQRLSMPISQIKSDFLMENEKAILETRDQEGKPSTLKVIVLDPCFNEFSLCLNKWNMTTTSIYNLVQDWRDVLSKNNFKKDQEIDIWSFRVNGKLYILLHAGEPKKIEKNEEPSNSNVISKTKEEQKKPTGEDC